MIDIHTHITYSDGSLLVIEFIEETYRIGLSLLSITDHNTIQSYYYLKKQGIRNLLSGNMITGVGITTTYNGETIEVLGYEFDIEKMKQLLDDNVLTYEEKQIRKYNLIKNRYKQIGVIFNENNINFTPNIELSQNSFIKEIKRYTENNRFFLNKESIYSVSSITRNEEYNPKSSLYVDETSLLPSLDKTISMIQESGGISLLAIHLPILLIFQKNY